MAARERRETCCTLQSQASPDIPQPPGEPQELDTVESSLQHSSRVNKIKREKDNLVKYALGMEKQMGALILLTRSGFKSSHIMTT